MTRARCSLCGEWCLTNGVTIADLAAGFKCPECRYAIAETRRRLADVPDEADPYEQPTLVSSAQNAQPLPAVERTPLVDERPQCLPEPEPGVTYCALAFIVFTENSTFPVVPSGTAEICPMHFADIYDAVTRQYGPKGLSHAALLAITRVRCEWWIRAANAQAARIEARYSR